jgi:Fic family protein
VNLTLEQLSEIQSRTNEALNQLTRSLQILNEVSRKHREAGVSENLLREAILASHVATSEITGHLLDVEQEQ